MTSPSTYFAPQLFVPNGVTDISFYAKAFGAEEIMRKNNEDGSIHVAELSIRGAGYYLHEETPDTATFSPSRHNGTTVLIGLFVEDVFTTMQNAINAGGNEIAAVQDYDYGLRQGVVQDPFGHRWLIQARI
jgi:PhnB protein